MNCSDRGTNVRAVLKCWPSEFNFALPFFKLLCSVSNNNVQSVERRTVKVHSWLKLLSRLTLFFALTLANASITQPWTCIETLTELLTINVNSTWFHVLTYL